MSAAVIEPGPWDLIAQEPREIRLKRPHWSVGSCVTRKGIAIVFGDDPAHARAISCLPDLLTLARRYASECAECNGSAEQIKNSGGGDPAFDFAVQCPECADIWAVINKATGELP